jgi:hypothetical protein
MTKRTKSGAKQAGWWPYEKRVEVITSYIATGSSFLVEGLTGVPSGTVRQWRTQDWWKELEGQLRTEGNLVLDAKLKKLVDRSLDAVLDRIEHGEFIFNVKTGQIDRMPAKLRDIAKVASDSIDKSVLLQKFTKGIDDVPKLDDHLKKLAQEFANIIKGSQDAIHDRRQERLQEGTELGAQEEAEPGEGSLATQCGSVPTIGESGESSPEGEGCGAQEGDLQGGDEHVGESGSTNVRPQ